MIKITTAVAALVLLASCSSSRGTTKHTDTPHQGSPSAYAPTTGADAAIIAEHITACTGVQSGDVGKGAPALSSTATCTLDGHLVIIDSFASASGPDDVPNLVDKTETYYAHGETGWLAFLADRGQTADKTSLQMQITNDAGGLLDYGLNGPPAPASLDAQQHITTVVAKALGGTVGHAGA